LNVDFDVLETSIPTDDMFDVVSALAVIDQCNSTEQVFSTVQDSPNEAFSYCVFVPELDKDISLVYNSIDNLNFYYVPQGEQISLVWLRQHPVLWAHDPDLHKQSWSYEDVAQFNFRDPLAYDFAVQSFKMSMIGTFFLCATFNSCSGLNSPYDKYRFEIFDGSVTMYKKSGISPEIVKQTFSRDKIKEMMHYRSNRGLNALHFGDGCSHTNPPISGYFSEVRKRELLVAHASYAHTRASIHGMFSSLGIKGFWRRSDIDPKKFKKWGWSGYRHYSYHYREGGLDWEIGSRDWLSYFLTVAGQRYRMRANIDSQGYRGPWFFWFGKDQRKLCINLVEISKPDTLSVLGPISWFDDGQPRGSYVWSRRRDDSS